MLKNISTISLICASLCLPIEAKAITFHNPEVFTQESSESNEEMFFCEEEEKHVQDLRVEDDVINGFVKSHYFSFDPVGQPKQRVSFQGKFTFSQDIIGIITDSALLDESDNQLRDDVDCVYPPIGHPFRGLENDDRISLENKTVNFENLTVVNKGKDEVRVLTKPEPSPAPFTINPRIWFVPLGIFLGLKFLKKGNNRC
jgi:hypothetical protein